MKDQLVYYISILFLTLLLQSSPVAVPIQPSEAKDALKKETRYFAFISLYSPREMYEKYQPLMDYLSHNTPYKFELRLGRDYREIIDFLKQGTAHIALLGAVTYLEAKKEFDVVPILAPLNLEGKPVYRTIFVTKAENKDINNLSDLKGKTLALASRWSTSGNLVPLYLLYKAGVRLEDLSRHCNLKYHDAVVREVLKGNCDAGAVIDSVALQYQEKGLKFIHISDPIPGLPIVVRSDAPKLFIDSVKMTLLALDPKIHAHREILGGWGDEMVCHGFCVIDDSHYDKAREMIDYLKREGVRVAP